jgi:hypothetical protein
MSSGSGDQWAIVELPVKTIVPQDGRRSRSRNRNERTSGSMAHGVSRRMVRMRTTHEPATIATARTAMASGLARPSAATIRASKRRIASPRRFMLRALRLDPC